MFRKKISTLSAAALLIAVFDAGFVRSQTPLTQVPAQAPIVVHVRGHDRTVGRIKKTLEASLGDLAAMATGQIDSALSSLLAGREIKALAPDGSLFIVFMALPEEEGEPDFAIVAKVSNYVQFRDGLLTDTERKNLKAGKAGYEDAMINEKPVFFMSKGDFAIVSFSEKAMKPFADKKMASLDGKLAKPVEQKLLENDLSVYVDAKQLNKQYGDKIAEFRQIFEQVFQQADAFPGMGKQMEAMKKVYAGIFQLVEDSEQFVAGVSFEPDGIRAQAHTIVGEKSATNKVFTGSQRLKLEQFGALPGGQMSYSSSAGGFDLIKILGFSMFGVGFPTPGTAPSDDKESQEFDAALVELTRLKFDAWYGATDYPSPGLQIVRYADNAKAAALTLAMYGKVKENSTFGGIPLKGKPAIKKDAEKLKGFTFHHVQLNWDLAKFLEALPEESRDQFKEMLQKTMGEELKVWFGTDGNQFLQINAKDWAAAAKLATNYLDGKETLAQDAGFTNMRKKLPAEGSLLVVLNAGKMALTMARTMGVVLRDFSNAPVADPKLPAGPPSYIGVVAAAESKQGSLDAWLPATGIKAIVDVFKPLFPNPDGQ